ncbi:MAG: DUF6345 domain-containing protein [Lachnospiraceae bacterium]|nr:DUF6345 domain-containing protein [Lachnospiraceae bacterium]MCI7594893.1 DUF6345 domain-containing protein [Lachnospiraceae bacterium]MDY3223926.1 DUF6345 domain-containing protein [Lachnospiraceae bacterium]MDY4095373.1 DUF6345 domain-containing protein [Lachnospiraceae bacterium]
MRAIKKLTICIAIATLLFSNNVSIFAAGKTIEAYKNNTYSGISDCEVMINGVKSQVSSYTSTFKNKNSNPGITQSDFTGKAKAIKYWASHGSNSGALWGDSGVSFNIMNINNFKWSGSNLEFVFLAACNQLDGANKNPRAKYANAMIGNNAVRVICGYHESAPPADENHDAAVATNFIAKAKTGESVKSSWIQANQIYGSANYCVLTHSGNVQYSRFEGFPGLTYSRPGSSSTTILRFSAANPGGINQPLSSGESSFSSLMQGLDIPDYSIKATETTISVVPTAQTTVLKLDNYLTTQNGEIGDEEIKISEEQALSRAKVWVEDVFDGITWSDYEDAELTILPIVMAEVDLDGNVENEKEVCVAYDISLKSKFNGIPIFDDKYCAIVDDSGVVSSAISHRNYEIIKDNDIKEKLKKEDIEKKFSSQDIDLGVIEDLTVAFMDDDGDGIFDPVVSVKTADGRTTNFNIISNKMSVY